MMLSAEQKQQFHDDGYIVLPDFKSETEILALKARAGQIVQNHDLDQHRTIFSTDKQRREQEVVSNDYFLDSDNSIACFLEEKAFDETGELTQPLSESINKIGHAIHDLDPVFEAFSTGDKLAALARDLGLSEPQIWQSMYIFKQPRIGGKVDWHQDGSFFYSEPLTVTTFWFALDDATLENGCLWVQKGGHNTPLRERFVRHGRSTKMIQTDDMPWPDKNTASPLEVKAGTLVCFNGKLPHYSAENTSDKQRHAYTLHVTDARSDYVKENWIQRGDDFPVQGFIRSPST
jgi:phytanoyl-CoA hydroxylase